MALLGQAVVLGLEVVTVLAVLEAVTVLEVVVELLLPQAKLPTSDSAARAASNGQTGLQAGLVVRILE